MKKIAIVGSGPTGIYSARYLLESDTPLSITIFEAQQDAGKGTPYHQDWNESQMLANIASIELPPVTESLVDWLSSLDELRLMRLGIIKEDGIDERVFYPRIALGEYFQTQLTKLVTLAVARGHTLDLHTSTMVKDITVDRDGIRLDIRYPSHEAQQHYDYAIMATGHVWPKQSQIRPGYYLSPWPASALNAIPDCHVGIRGTSLSGIDAAVALAVARGQFFRNEKDDLTYIPEPGTEKFRLTMMSRKGLLPEADFYYPIPYEPLGIFTAAAIGRLIASNPRTQLLDDVYALFKAQLLHSDPAYAAKIQLDSLSLEQFTHAYFAERETNDPFDWARSNLKETKTNQDREYTVSWRYAILRMHEVIKDIIRHFDAKDHQRFNNHLKQIFVDDYATVPHESIERLLALNTAGKLSILRLGENYDINDRPAEGGATICTEGTSMHFPAFIEATGQRTLSAHEFPFPSLWAQGIITNATAPHLTYSKLGQPKREAIVIGGIALDTEFHPVSTSPYAMNLYCLSLPFLLGQFPFAQGITSSHEMGKSVAEDLIAHFAADESFSAGQNPIAAGQRGAL